LATAPTTVTTVSNISRFLENYRGALRERTHVLFNPERTGCLGPPYSAANATPPGGLDMGGLPLTGPFAQTHPTRRCCFFTYAVLGGTGGAASALTDIHASTKRSSATRTQLDQYAVGFHGYAARETPQLPCQNILSTGYPCFMTEFGAGTWGGTGGGLDVEAVANLERLGVSWPHFQYILPPAFSR